MRRNNPSYSQQRRRDDRKRFIKTAGSTPTETGGTDAGSRVDLGQWAIAEKDGKLVAYNFETGVEVVVAE